MRKNEIDKRATNAPNRISEDIVAAVLDYRLYNQNLIRQPVLIGFPVSKEKGREERDGRE